jgi:hypothetical protein
VTFSTGMAEQKFKLQSATPAQLRKGFVAHWEALHEDLLWSAPLSVDSVMLRF